MTEILESYNPGAIERAAELVRLGHLVAFPTDTLYGVGADISNSEAIKKLYQAKNRSRDKGIPILLAAKEHVHSIAEDIPPEAEALMDGYWPGPLTLILKKQANLAPELSPNIGIAVRVPGNDVARALIKEVGGAMAVTSANLSGSDAALTAREALEALEGAISAVVDGGPVQLGVASTIIDFTSHPARLVRPGPIPANVISRGEAKQT